MPGDSYKVVDNHSFKAIWTTEKGKDGTALGEGASAVAKVSASGKVKAVKKEVRRLSYMHRTVYLRA